MWSSGWDHIFRTLKWGRYPPEEVVRFVAQNFYSTEDRSKVRILDIGCGIGANLWFIAREGFDAVGVDGSKVGLEQAEERMRDERLRATLVHCDAMSLPFEPQSFDAVIDNECIYANDWADSLSIIKEVHRVLKPGGKFLSRTFAVGTSVEGEADAPNTFVKVTGGVLRPDYGLVRLTDEADIEKLYGVFGVIKYELSERTQAGRTRFVREWTIVCDK